MYLASQILLLKKQMDVVSHPVVRKVDKEKSLRLEPLNKLSPDRQWSWYLEKDSLLSQLFTSFKFAPCDVD